MELLYLLLMIAAVVCFVLAVALFRGVASSPRLVALGLLFWALVPTLQLLVGLDL